MSIKSALKARIRKELIRREKINKPRGIFQMINSDKDLRKAKNQLQDLRKKHPGQRIPVLRVFLANASKIQKHRNCQE